MKKIILASLMAIAMVASASALDVKPYLGYFPIGYSSSTYASTSRKDVDSSNFYFGGSQPIYVGVKVSDFRTDFMVSSGFYLSGFNVYYDFNISDSFLPYAKLGINYSCSSDDNPNYFTETESSNTTLAIGAGIGYKVVGNFILDAGIQYNLTKSKQETKNTSSGVTTKTKSTTSGFGAKLGARLQF